MKKYYKKLICISFSFVLLLSLLFSSITTVLADDNNDAQWPAYPDIYAEAGVLIEASTGTVLYDKNSNNQMYPASITKILTTLLALENGNLTDMVDFSHYDIYSLEFGDAHISMKEGEQLSLKDCLYGVMLASANEVANAVGEYVAKKQPEYTKKIEELKASGQEYDESLVAIQVFADMMNQRASKAGAKNSHFCNPNGLFNENHYTTCYDMAMITRDAIMNEQFLQIEANTTYTIPATNLTAETRPIANRHKMLFPLNSVYYEGALGGKTGYVDQSGSTLVTFAKRNGMTLISVVMKSNGANVYNDTKLLLDYGFNNFSLSNISDNEKKFNFNNSGFKSNETSVFSTDNSLISLNTTGNVVLPNGTDFTKLKSTLTFIDPASQTGNSIAKLDYFYGDKNVGGTTLDVNESNNSTFTFGPAKDQETNKSDSKDNFITINVWMLLGIVITIVIIIVVIYYLKATKKVRVRRKRRKKISKNKLRYR